MRAGVRRFSVLVRVWLALSLLGSSGTGLGAWWTDLARGPATAVIQSIGPAVGRLGLATGLGAVGMALGPAKPLFAAAMPTATPRPSKSQRPLTSPADYQNAVLSDAPLAYYRLDQTSGTTATDLSGNGLNGTITGGVTLGTTGGLTSDPDPSMTFDGQTGYVALPNGFSSFPNGMTVEGWIRPTAATRWNRLIDLGKWRVQ